VLRVGDSINRWSPTDGKEAFLVEVQTIAGV
jgi:hypothetical protein